MPKFIQTWLCACKNFEVGKLMANETQLRDRLDRE